MAILPANTTVAPPIPHMGTPLTPQGEFTPIELLSGAVNSLQNDAPAQANSFIERLQQVSLAEESNGPLNITEVALAILSYCDLRTLQSLACVNKFLNGSVQAYEEQLDLQHLCPELRILDAKAQGFIIPGEPHVSKLWIWKNYRELEPHVEKREGLTLLTMPQGRTLGQLIAIAAEAGINATLHWIHHQIVEEHGNVPIEQTYVVLITNSVFQQSRSKSYAQQQELVARHRCVMPTVQEYVALCVFTNRVFQKCLYRQNGQNPWTYGRTSTQVDGHPLVVGGSSPARLVVSRSANDCKDCGVGGQRKVSF